MFSLAGLAPGRVPGWDLRAVLLLAQHPPPPGQPHAGAMQAESRHMARPLRGEEEGTGAAERVVPVLLRSGNIVLEFY